MPGITSLAYLGELSTDEQDGWSQLGLHLDGKSPTRGFQRSLFDPPCQNAPQDDEPLLVKLSGIRLGRPRDFGDVWLAWGLWRILGLGEFFDERIERGREEFSWGPMAAILTIARFCEPASELHIADTWYDSSGAGPLELPWSRKPSPWPSPGRRGEATASIVSAPL